MKLGFGVMRLPLVDDNKGNVDMIKTQALFDAFIAAGGVHFDTGYRYHLGQSELAFRELVAKRYPRDSFTITDKMPIFLTREESQMAPIFDEQLEKCGVDYFDYYWLHGICQGEYRRCQKINAFEFMQRKKEEGKIRYSGFSFHESAEKLDEILTAHPEVDFVQLQVNYLDWEDPVIQSRACCEVAAKHGKPVFVMEPVKGGTLVNLPEEALALLKAYDPDATLASWALRFVASQPNIHCILSGMSTPEQVDENMKLFKDLKPLTEEETALLAKVAEIIRSDGAVACTSCRYCVEGCPKKIAIPEYFTLYNQVKRNEGNDNIFFNAQMYYDSLTRKGNGKASDCIQCGKCEEHCPQHLPIRNLLKIIGELLPYKKG